MAERRTTALTLAMMVAIAPTRSCLKKKPAEAQPAATTTASAAPSASASASVAVPTDAGAASVDAGTTAKAAVLDKSRVWLADLKAMIAKKSSTNPRKDGDGDAASICEAAVTARAASAADADAELRANLDEAAALCAFDVPLLTASEALDQLHFSPSQASRLLMCKVSRREIDRARAVHPKDARVRQLEGRRGALCK